MPAKLRSAHDQNWSASSYQTHARFVSDLSGAVMEWLAPRPGEHILDLGCGDGVIAEDLMARGVDVIGVDSSAAFVAAARARGVDARLMDGQRLTFASEFDAVFSNAALHWMTASIMRPSGVARGLIWSEKPSEISPIST